MAKRCTRCGNFMMDDERFCPNCGENAQFAPSSQTVAPPVNNAYQQPQPTYQNPYVSAVSAAARDDEIMTLGKWVGTIVVTTFFGLISLIFLFIWGFGEGPEARRRYCKAMLIVTAISVVLSIIVSLIFFGMFTSAMNSYISEYGDYYNYNSSNFTAAVQQAAAYLSAMIH